MRDNDTILLESLYAIVSEHNENILPIVFDQLKKYDMPLVGVHFSKGLKKFGTPHLGLQKNPAHGDPIGVYAFPKDYVLSGGLSKNIMFSQLPFFYIIKPSASAKILNLSELKEDKCKEMLSLMGIPLNYWDRDDIYHKSDHAPKAGLRQSQHIGRRFWGVLEKFRHDTKRGYDNVSWNVLFKKTGYNVLYDNGEAIIHSNEPNQIVYLETSAYEVLYFGRQKDPKNKVYEIFIKTFSDYRVKKYTKGELRLYLESPSKDSYINITPWQYGFEIVVGGFTEDYKKSYRWDDIGASDFQTIVNDAKTFIEKNKNNIRNKVVEDDDTVIKLISDHFKLAMTKTRYGNMIIKRYKDGSTGDFVTIFQISSNKNGDMLTFHLSKKGTSKYAYYGQTYNVNALVTINKENIKDINNLMKDGFNKLKNDIEESHNELYKKQQMLKTVSFIENRVFKLK